MKMPARITPSWLGRTRPGFGPNAHRILEYDDFVQIRGELFDEFLAVRGALDNTTLHLIASDDDLFRAVAEFHPECLTPEAMCARNANGETPLSIALNSSRNLIPWKKIKGDAEAWIPYLDLLEETQKAYRDAGQISDSGINHEDDPGLATVIKEVRIRKKLQSVKRIGLKAKSDGSVG